MKIFVNWLYAISLCILFGSLAQAQPNASTNLLRNGDFAQGTQEWQLILGDRATATLVDAQAGPFRKAMRYDVKPQPGDHAYIVQLAQLITDSFKVGDRVVLKAWLRSPQKSKIRARVEKSGAPFTHLAHKEMELSPEWQEFEVVGRSIENYAPGSVRFCFHLGFAPGTVEIAGVRLFHLPPVPELDLQLGHQGIVSGITFSPDGTTVATGSEDSTVKLWDAATGSLRQTLKIGFRVRTLAYTPDGKMLVVAGETGNPQLRDARTGALLQVLQGETSWVPAIQLSPDGKFLYGAGHIKGEKGRIAIWNAQTGASIKVAGDFSTPLKTLALSPNGKLLATSGADKVITLWDASTGTMLRIVEQSETDQVEGVETLAFSPDGEKLMSARWNGKVQVHQVSSGKLLQTIAPNRPISGLIALSPRGNLLVIAGGDSPPHLLDATTGNLIAALPASNWTRSLAFSPDGAILATGDSVNTITLWDARNGSVRQVLGSNVAIGSMALAPDGTSVLTGNGARLWNLKTGEMEKALTSPGEALRVAWSPDGKLWAGAMRNNSVCLWSAQTGALLKTLSGHTAEIRMIAFSPDSKLLASAGEDKIIKLWDAQSGAELRSLSGHSLLINCVRFSPDGKTLVSGGRDHSVQVWDVQTGNSLKTLAGHTNWVRDIAFSPDGNLIVTVGRDQKAILWDKHKGTINASVSLPTDTLSAVFTPDNKTIVAGDDKGSIHIINATSGTLLQTFRGHSGQLWGLSLLPDGHTLVSGSDDGTLKLWDMNQEWRLLATLFSLPPKPTSTKARPLIADAKALTADAKPLIPDAREVNDAGEYLAVTPEGYYAGSAQADRFMRFKLGEDSFPAESFQMRYYRPDLVKKALGGEALPTADEFKGSFPPVTAFANTANISKITGNTTTVTLETSDDSDVKSVAFFVNGTRVDAKVTATEARPLTSDSRALTADAKALTADAKLLAADAREIPSAHKTSRRFTATLPLPSDAKEIKVQAIAFDDDGLQSPREEILFTRDAATAMSGRLLGLCVGVSRYADPKLNLRFADADANALAQALNQQRGIYSSAQVNALTNESATRRAVSAALDNLVAQTSRTDTVIVSLSGHGWRADERSFYFATHEVQRTDVANTALPWRDVTERLTQLSQKSKRVIMLLDACHSGSAASNEELVKAILNANAGVMVFASSKGSEVSLENAEWQHGAFTKALLEGIAGKAADESEKSVTLWDFATYVRRRVKQLTEGAQNPQVPFLQDFDTDAAIIAKP